MDAGRASPRRRREVRDGAAKSRALRTRMAFHTTSLEEVARTQCRWRKGPGSRGIANQRSERGGRASADGRGVIKEKGEEAQENAGPLEGERRASLQGRGKGPLSYGQGKRGAKCVPRI